ncbi:hypothetical protein ASPZODRAFT_150068 [Penicilliopsis zonata CBS 506.65]|uniref:Dynactin subunit 6 n=1 Tax=Penicilliopsis zonata CBS 506.65 TaxID=1073090 RepID=A0A1L9SPD2_9EURO|nr:hypothetical protein ASPZODRAFT_150068 [Penicilliopsis zonata CBS 506.65]OJJ49129.1 hypothetical protein ASPZODRAFT_150068 [Penicilliopsis zonata CBS 506.65]
MDKPSSQHLKPPSSAIHHHHHHHHHQQRVSSSSSATPRPPLTVHASATVADTVVFQGTHPISIGAGTVIHPRAKLYSYDGPLSIGEGCIIGEKSSIGASPTPTSTTTTPTTPTTTSGSSEAPSIVKTRISNAVTIAPLAIVFPGAYIHSAAIVESSATIHRGASVGSHSKICGGCHVPPNGNIPDWTVVWGVGSNSGQRRRKRTTGKIVPSAVVAAGSVTPQQQGVEGRLIEDARLVVLQRERETLVHMIGGSATARRR